MAYVPNSDEKHLLELACPLPDEDDERFWNRVSELSGCEAGRLEFNTALRNVASHGRCLTLADVMLGLFGPSEHRDKLAHMIGSRQLTTAGQDGRGVGEQWIQDAVSTAWRVRFPYSRPQGEDPLEVLKRKGNLE